MNQTPSTKHAWDNWQYAAYVTAKKIRWQIHILRAGNKSVTFLLSATPPFQCDPRSMRKSLAILLIIMSFSVGALFTYVLMGYRIKATNAALEEVRRVTLKFMSKIDAYRLLERVKSDSDTVEYLISIDRRGRPIGAVIKDAGKRLEEDSASLQEKRNVLEAEQDKSLDFELMRAKKLISEARFWY